VKGVILMAYGSPASIEDVEAYYTHIRGGRKPSPEQLRNLISRYRAIGGPSPLLKITKSQADGLQASLSKSGSSTRVYAGMKHSEPFIGEVLTGAKSDGVTDLLCVAMAPHYSGISIGGYMKAVEDANGDAVADLKVKFVKSWHTKPGLISLWAKRVASLIPPSVAGAEVIFSAHSLPERILREGDPYRDQLLETSRLIAREADCAAWSFAFQSASKTGEPWLGPDILDHLQSRFESGKRHFIVAPIGFVSDHLEILYDIDVECRNWSDRVGARMLRCESPNDSPVFIACLKSIVEENGFA
jgi:protoporphyrin/coproporphyrin ferrochelatase